MSCLANSKKLFVCVVTILIFVFTSFQSNSHTSERISPYRIIGLYLYNFLMFVDWPNEVLDVNDKITIGIFGTDHFADTFIPIQGKTIKGRKIVIRQLKGIRDLNTPCQVLFISSSEKKQAPKIVENLKDAPVLTVSDIKGFARIGGMVGFWKILQWERSGYPLLPVEKNKRFEINLTAVKRAGLKIRARLLRIADIVQNDQHGQENNEKRDEKNN
jgi:hypothetical protein